MPADKREFITLPVDIHRHPVIQRLPADVRWTFVEMNIEALVARNDGKFAIEDAEFLFPVDHLDKLVKSHPRKPLVKKTKEQYVIREYASHQLTNELREERARVSRENGAKGGRPKKKPEETQPGSAQVIPEPGRNPEEPGRLQSQESRVKSQEPLTTTYVNESSYVTERARKTDDSNDDAGGVDRAFVAAAIEEGIDVDAINRALKSRLGIETTPKGAAWFAYQTLDKSRGTVPNKTGYVIRTIQRSGPEVTDDFQQGRISE